VARQPWVAPVTHAPCDHEQVYALFDRRCRPRPPSTNWPSCGGASSGSQPSGHAEEALCPTLEKALTFLDDTLLPSTSNCGGRGNRRYRKMQRNVYRVRTQVQICARLALDMWREAKPKAVNKPSKHYMRRVQDENNPVSLLQSRFCPPSHGVFDRLSLGTASCQPAYHPAYRAVFVLFCASAGTSMDWSPSDSSSPRLTGPALGLSGSSDD